MDDSTKSLFEMFHMHYLICNALRRFNTYFGLQLLCSVLSHVLVILGELYIIHRFLNTSSDFLASELITIFLIILLEVVDMVIFIKHCGKTCPMVSTVPYEYTEWPNENETEAFSTQYFPKTQRHLDF